MTKNSARPGLASAAARLAEIQTEIAKILHVFPFLAAGGRRQRQARRQKPKGIRAVLSQRAARRRQIDAGIRGVQG
jgi:hypothetical protein